MLQNYYLQLHATRYRAKRDTFPQHLHFLRRNGSPSLYLPQSQFLFLLTDFNSSTSRVSVTFIDREGTPLTVKAKVGDTFLDAAVNNDVDLEGFG